MSKHSAPIHVSTSILSQILIYLKTRNIDPQDVLENAKLNRSLLDSPDSVIPIATYLKIEAEAANLSMDPCFGLHVGEYAEAGSWSILGYIMMNCKTLGEALQKTCRYSRIIGNLVEPQIFIEEDQVSIRYTSVLHAPLPTRHCMESSLSTSIRLMRSLTGKRIIPLNVKLSFPQPETTAEYHRIFGCVPNFCQPENAIILDKSILEIPVLVPNQQLLTYFENMASDLLTQLERRDEFTREVTNIILAHLDDESLSIEFTADQLAISVRTLQNRLKAENVIFSDLLGEIRSKMAQKYLREQYTVEQITCLIGFSEPAAFRKAFKRWTGLTPRIFSQRVESHYQDGN